MQSLLFINNVNRMLLITTVTVVKATILYLLLTGIQETQEQASSSTHKEALSTVTNRFELQEVCRVFIRHRRSKNSPATTQNSPDKFCLFPVRALLFHNSPLWKRVMAWVESN